MTVLDLLCTLCWVQNTKGEVRCNTVHSHLPIDPQHHLTPSFIASMTSAFVIGETYCWVLFVCVYSLEMNKTLNCITVFLINSLQLQTHTIKFLYQKLGKLVISHRKSHLAFWSLTKTSINIILESIWFFNMMLTVNY